VDLVVAVGEGDKAVDVRVEAGGSVEVDVTLGDVSGVLVWTRVDVEVELDEGMRVLVAVRVLVGERVGVAVGGSLLGGMTKL
jgi:hypothetical protein